MFDLLASQEAIAFVGAGLSTELYPPWKALLQNLRVEANKIGKFEPPEGFTEDDPLLFADEIQRYFKRHDGNLNRYYEILGQQFALTARGCTSTHEKLVRLPFKGYVTTNYDQSLETALIRAGNTRPDCAVVVKKHNKDAHKVSEFLLSLDDRKLSQRVAHLHGLENQTEEIVLSAWDYQQAYGFRQSRDGNGATAKQDDWTLHRKLVWALLATRRLIFFGFSFTDPYLTKILRDVTADLWSRRIGRHFAIAPLDRNTVGAAQTREREFLEYGVQIVFYDNLDANHAELVKLIEIAVERFGHFAFPRSRQLTPGIAGPTPPNGGTPQRTQTSCAKFFGTLWQWVSHRQEIQPNLGWLEEINTETEGDLQKP